MKNNVAIGIPVLNEASNIGPLIRALLRQRTDGFRISEIYLLSDGSTDRTNAIITEYARSDTRIKPLIYRERLGKPIRVNQIFSLARADVVVILDGDIRIHSRTVIASLVAPILEDGVSLTSGRGMYRVATTYFERIFQTGIDMWSEVKETARDAAMYTCEGKIRAFSRPLYRKMRFPSLSAEDVYPYLYCLIHGLRYSYVPEATVYYRLPTTLRDYIRQHARFLQSRDVQRRNFSAALIREAYTISWQEKVPVVLRYFLKRPVRVALYLLVLVVPKITVHFDTDSLKGDWSVIQSTKL